MECAICLNRIDLHNESYIYPCFHRYCFTCIHRWTESQQKHKSFDQEATTCLCPLCKAPYTQIIYDCVGSSYRSLATTGQAPNDAALPLTAAHNRRRALYLTRLATPSDLGRQESLQAQAIKRAQPRVPTNPQTATFIARDLQAVLLEEDVDLITQHVLGSLKALSAKQSKARCKGPAISPVYGAHHAFIEAVSQAVSSFLHEPPLSQTFAEELWAFLHSGLSVSGYDRLSFGGSKSNSGSEQEEEAPFVPADDPTE